MFDVKNPNICRYIMLAFMTIGLVIAGISGIVYDVEPIHPLFVIGAVISFGSIIFGIITIRCPYCHKQLHLDGIMPNKFCPYCGKKIMKI